MCTDKLIDMDEPSTRRISKKMVILALILSVVIQTTLNITLFQGTVRATVVEEYKPSYMTKLQPDMVYEIARWIKTHREVALSDKEEKLLKVMIRERINAIVVDLDRSSRCVETDSCVVLSDYTDKLSEQYYVLKSTVEHLGDIENQKYLYPTSREERQSTSIRASFASFAN